MCSTKFIEYEPARPHIWTITIHSAVITLRKRSVMRDVPLHIPLHFRTLGRQRIEIDIDSRINMNIFYSVHDAMSNVFPFFINFYKNPIVSYTFL